MLQPIRHAGVIAVSALVLFIVPIRVNGADAPEPVDEIRPGLLAGYLPADPSLDSSAFLPPAPAPGSATQLMDERLASEKIPARDSERWDQAVRDADVTFPAAAGAFSCAVGLPISEPQTPFLNRLLRRTLTDAAMATGPAKQVYGRERPFVQNGQPTCTPEDEQKARHSGSYPSGHAAAGWTWALLLSELVPEQAAAILSRGLAFGESREICNLHWHSDITAGQLLGAAIYARLQNDAAFRRDLERARGEVARMRAAGLPPGRDCVAEARALSGSY